MCEKAKSFCVHFIVDYDAQFFKADFLTDRWDFRNYQDFPVYEILKRGFSMHFNTFSGFQPRVQDPLIFFWLESHFGCNRFASDSHRMFGKIKLRNTIQYRDYHPMK